MTTTDHDKEIKRRVSIAMTGSAVPVVKAPPPPADLLARTKKPLGPYNAHSQASVAGKDEDTKRRLSLGATAMLPVSKVSAPSLQLVSSSATTSAALSKGKSQVEGDEVAKRRASALVQVAMRPMEPAAMAIPPQQLIVPPLSSPMNASVGSSPSFLPTSDAPAPTSPIQQKPKTKRRMAISLSQVEATQKGVHPQRLVPPVSPSSLSKVSLDPIQENTQSPLLLAQSPMPPSWENLIVPSPASSTASREPVSVAFPKARVTPNSSPVAHKPSSLDRKPLPLIPSAGDMEHRGLGDRKHRVSLPPSSPRRLTSYGPLRQLGQRKQRLSLPNASTITSASSPGGWREQRKQRVSLPPSSSGSFFPAAQTNADSDSETEQLHVKRRLGERKHRVSLPPSMSSGTTSDSHQNNRQRASMPPTIPSQQRTNATCGSAPTMQRRLGERKSNRLSLPNSSVSLDHMVARRPSVSSTCSSEGDMLDSAICDVSSSSNDTPNGNLPQKGLRRNSGNLRPPTPNLSPTPNLAGPGAFFVPADALTAQDVEQRTSFRGMNASDQGIEQHTSVRGMDVLDQGIEHRSSFRIIPEHAIEQQSSRHRLNAANEAPVEQGSSILRPCIATAPKVQECLWDFQHPDPTESSTIEDDNMDVEASIELGQGNNLKRGITPAPAPHATSSVTSVRPAGSSSIVRMSVVSTRNLDEGAEVSEPKSRQSILPWWCSIVLPLIFVASLATAITVVIKSFTKAGNSYEETSAPSLAPLVHLFDDNTMIPDFTSTALEDPKSPQSKALEWLLADPIATTYSQSRKLQRFALATIYYSVNGARWKNSTHWLSHENECTWFSSHPNASICNDDLEYTYLALDSNSMLGTLPAEISLLTSLEEIALGSNRLHGPLPSQIGSLSRLSKLDSPENELEGTIPTELAQLSNNLQILDLGENQLSGSLPTELLLLSRLEELHLTDNALTATIPRDLGKLDRLQVLRFGGNNLSGKIPSQLGLLTQMTMLNIGANQLTGNFPSEIGALSQLTFLGIAQLTRLQATLPTELAALTDLETLFATSSGISGPIPEQIGRMTSLRAISLAACRISGTLPTLLGRLTNAEWMYYYDNNDLRGSLPSELGLLTSLKIFHAFVTQLDSTIPSQMGKLTELTELQLFDSMLTGELPSQLGNLSDLTELNIKNTELSGSFPESTCILLASQQLTITADCDRMECCKA